MLLLFFGRMAYTVDSFIHSFAGRDHFFINGLQLSCLLAFFQAEKLQTEIASS
jgi:hypothetical protein